MSIRVNSHFAGCGLIEIGLQQAGVEVQQSFELDGPCCAVHRANFSHETVQCDLTQKLVSESKGRDVDVYTFPCNKYSPTADLHEARTGEELYLHALRNVLVDPPEAFVCENVPGMRAFPVVMEALTKLHGYFTTVFCPVQSMLWLPQDRPRLIIFGSRRPFAWRPPTARRRVKLRHIVERDARPHFPANALSRLRGKYRDRPIISDPERDDIAPLCVAHYHKDRGTRMIADRSYRYGARPYTVREYARLQGVPDWFEFPVLDSHAYRMIGNGVSVPVGRWIGQELRRYFAS